MFCKFCGAQLPDGTKFCNFCGAQLSSPQENTEYQVQPDYVQNFNMPVPPPPPAPENKSNNKAIIAAAIIAVILVIGVVLTVILVKNNGGDSKEKEDTEKASTSESVQSSASSPIEDSTTQSTSIESPTQPTVPNNPSAISRGVISGNTYTNTFAGITITKPSSWTFASDKQLEEQFGIVLDGYTDFEQEFIKNSTIYDMMLVSPSASNIMVMYEDLSVSGSQNISIDDYVDILTRQLKAQTALNYTILATYTGSLAGENYTIIDAEASSNGGSVFQRYYLRKQGKYIIGIVISARSEMEFSTIENMFSSYI